MAGFTAELTDPGRLSGGGGGDRVSGAGIVGGALSGLADIANVALGHMRENEARDTANDVSKKLTDLVVTNFGQNPDGTKLVGEPPTDPNAAAAGASPVVQRTMSALDRLHQANQQGAMNPTELMTRGSVIVQDAINQNPLFATEIRQAAQAVLGTQPTEALTRLALSDSAAADAEQRQIKLGAVQAAANAGVTFMNPDGSFDFDKMADAGFKLNYSEKIQSDLLKQAQLAAAAAGPAPTDSDKLNAEVMPFVKGMNPHFEEVQAGLLSSVPATLQKLANAGDQQKLAGVLQALGVQKSIFTGYLDQMILKNNISPKAAEQIHQYYDGIWKNYETLAGGSLDHWSLLEKSLKAMKDKGQMDFLTASPALAQVLYAGGPQAIAPVINTAIGTNPQLQNRMNAETAGYINKFAKPEDVIAAYTSVLQGQGYTVTREQSPDMQRKVLGSLVGTINAYGQAPDSIPPAQLTSFGNAISQVTAQGFASNDPVELRNAADTVNSPGVARLYERFIKDPKNANLAPLVTQGLLALHGKYLQNNLPIIAQGADTTISARILPTGPNGTFNFSDAMAAASGEGNYPGTQGIFGNTQVQVHASAVFNPLTGKIEFQASAVGPDGKRYATTPDETAAILKNFADYRSQIDTANRSLDMMASVAPHSIGRERDLKPLELRQMVAATSGFPNRPGTRPVPLPDWLTKPKPAASGGQGAANPSPTPNPPPADGNGPSPLYRDRVKAHESGGDYSIHNQTGSSAGGAYQFLPDTFRAMVRLLPDGKKMTDADIEKLRTSDTPAGRSLQDRAFDAYTMKNTADLNAHGIQHVDDTALELAHWFGGAGANKFLHAPMDTKIEDLFGAKVAKQNPNLRGKTVKEVYNELAARFGGRQL